MSRLSYYLSSLPVLLRGIKNWAAVIAGLVGRNPFVLELRDGLRLNVRGLMDLWIVKETCLDRQYERFGVQIQDGWSVLDIGAGLGDFTISTARAHPHSLVLGYEPFIESYQLLQQNVALNRVSNVRAYPYAIAAREGELQLQFMGQAVQHKTLAESTGSEGGVRVKSISLGQALAGQGLDLLDYLKVDCEGGEYDIFFGMAPETLHAIRHICLEYHDGVTAYGHQDLARFFAQHGFEVRSEPNPVHSDLGLMYARNRL